LRSSSGWHWLSARRSKLVVDNHRLGVVIRNRTCDGCRADSRSNVVGVAVSVAGVEVARAQRTESPTDATPDDGGIPRATPIT